MINRPKLSRTIAEFNRLCNSLETMQEVAATLCEMLGYASERDVEVTKITIGGDFVAEVGEGKYFSALYLEVLSRILCAQGRDNFKVFLFKGQEMKDSLLAYFKEKVCGTASLTSHQLVFVLSESGADGAEVQLECK